MSGLISGTGQPIIFLGCLPPPPLERTTGEQRLALHRDRLGIDFAASCIAGYGGKEGGGSVPSSASRVARGSGTLECGPRRVEL
jgi:hypothetical protein